MKTYRVALYAFLAAFLLIAWLYYRAAGAAAIATIHTEATDRLAYFEARQEYTAQHPDAGEFIPLMRPNDWHKGDLLPWGPRKVAPR